MMTKKEKQKPKSIDATDLLQFSVTNAAEAKTIRDCLINPISRLELELKDLKAFASGGAAVMAGVNNGAAARLLESQNITHMLNSIVYAITWR